MNRFKLGMIQQRHWDLGSRVGDADTMVKVIQSIRDDEKENASMWKEGWVSQKTE